MATSTRLSVFLSIVLNHIVHVASFKLHYFGFALQILSPPDIHSLRKRLLYCLLHFLLLCDTLLMTPNHNKTAVQNCGSSWCKRDVLRTRQNKISLLNPLFLLFSFLLYGIWSDFTPFRLKSSRSVIHFYLTNREASTVLCCKARRERLKHERSVGRNTRRSRVFLPASWVL